MTGVDLCSMSPRAMKLRNQRDESRSAQPVHLPDQPKGILRQTSDVPNKPKTIEQLAKLAVNVVCGKTTEPEIKKPEPPKTEKKVGPTHGVAFGKTIPVLNQKNNTAAKTTRPTALHDPYKTSTAREVEALKKVVEEQGTIISNLKNEVEQLKKENGAIKSKFQSIFTLIDGQNTRLAKLEHLNGDRQKGLASIIEEKKALPKDSVVLKKEGDENKRLPKKPTEIVKFEPQRDGYDDDSNIEFGDVVNALNKNPGWGTELIKLAKNPTRADVTTKQYYNGYQNQSIYHEKGGSFYFEKREIHYGSPSRRQRRTAFSTAVDDVLKARRGGYEPENVRPNVVEQHSDSHYEEEEDLSEEDCESDDDSLTDEYSRPADCYDVDDSAFASTVQSRQQKKESVGARLGRNRGRKN